MRKLEIFDAVRIVSLPDGQDESPVYYSQTGRSHIRVGDIGVVIGDWPWDRYRVEAVDEHGAIVWQDHFESECLELLPATDATYSRRRINERWAYNLGLSGELLDGETRKEALWFARKVMAFARRNVDLLFERLERLGYQFANGALARQQPEDGVAECVEELAQVGVHVPVALQAWLMEVGGVDLCGTHPDWPRTGCFGMGDDDPSQELWYTDPLVISVSLEETFENREDCANCADVEPPDGLEPWIEIAPDAVTKVNVSGAGPISISGAAPRFDTFLMGQHGSFTLLSYLRFAFAWGGSPGFEYIVDPPEEMLTILREGLTRL